MNEREIKALVLRKLLADGRISRRAIVASEYRMGRTSVRADLAILDKKFFGVEIKSDFDSLKRLDRQHQVYLNYFDCAIFVIAERHIPRLDFARLGGGEVWSLRSDGSLEIASTATSAQDMSDLKDLMTKAEVARYCKGDVNDIEIREAFLRAFSARFAITSENFWSKVGAHIESNDIQLLSRFQPQRVAQAELRASQSKAWELWASADISLACPE